MRNKQNSNPKHLHRVNLYPSNVEYLSTNDQIVMVSMIALAMVGAIVSGALVF